jgi:hypothetical protein
MVLEHAARFIATYQALASSLLVTGSEYDTAIVFANGNFCCN